MAAINQEEQELRDCLAQIGWSDRQCDAIVAEGFEGLEDLREMLSKDVSNVRSTISKLAANRGGVRIGHALVQKLKGLVCWIKDHPCRGQVADAVDWDPQICKDSTYNVDLEDQRADDSAKLEPPGKLKDGDWVQWELKLVNCLQNVLGTSGVPLHCVIRKDLPPNHQLANPAEELVHESPLHGLVCTEDNRKVFGVIKQAVADTQNWDWIKSLNRAQDGRAAVTVLGTHFDGPGEVEKRVAQATNATWSSCTAPRKAFSLSRPA